MYVEMGMRSGDMTVCRDRDARMGMKNEYMNVCGDGNECMGMRMWE